MSADDRTPEDALAAAERTAAEARAAQPDAPAARWQAQLPRTKEGTTKATFRALCLILRHDPTWAGRLGYHEMWIRPTLDGAPLTDGDVGRIRERIEEVYGCAPDEKCLRAAVANVAHERRVHPVREYLRGLAWDGVPRLDRVAAEVLHSDGPMERVFLRKFLLGAAARVLRPGCKLDTALVVYGAQARLKSTFFRVLGGEWFSDSQMDIGNKDSLLQIRAAWIVEWGEIERITGRKDAEDVKAFLSRQDDLLRPPYGGGVDKYHRTAVIVGSTNKHDVLHDPTGDRRFWVVEVDQAIDLVLLRAWRDQLWAEAVAALDRDEPWWLTKDEDDRRDRHARRYRQSDPWEPLVDAWLTKNPGKTELTTAEVLMGAIGMRADKVDRAGEVRVGCALRALGWEAHRPRKDNPERKRVYQRREPDPPDPPPDQPVRPEMPPVHAESTSDQPRELQGGPSGPGDSRAYEGDEATSLSTYTSEHIGPIGPTRESSRRSDVSPHRTDEGSIGPGLTASGFVAEVASTGARLVFRGDQVDVEGPRLTPAHRAEILAVAASFGSELVALLGRQEAAP